MATTKYVVILSIVSDINQSLTEFVYMLIFQVTRNGVT